MEILSEINEIANLTRSLYIAMKKMPNDDNTINDNVVLSSIVHERMQSLRDEIFKR